MESKNNGIGRMLRNRREYLELSQQEIADYVGVSKSAISRWESGEISNIGLSRIKLIAEKLNIDPVAIVMGSEYKETDAADLPTTSEFEEYFKQNSYKLSNLPQNKKDNLIKLIELYLD